MWCWHRIRESESGLCPACRTPYGDDPHEFSAVDVADVLKANKEKAAAEKRERERLRQDEAEGGNSSMIGQMDVPKDRSQLANMRVIRRNLVYAVGLPPSIATEDTLRKPEYFGQYGKIAKIVLNRTNVTSSDPRRASASAYVTFVHKVRTCKCVQTQFFLRADLCYSLIIHLTGGYSGLHSCSRWLFHGWSQHSSFLWNVKILLSFH